MMKQFLIAALAFAAVTMAQDEDTEAETEEETGPEPSSACMYCRNEDLAAGFLTSFSYCEHQDICLQDEWNYIRRDCQSGWVRGNTYDLSNCNPETIDCPGFNSTTEYYQRYSNKTWSMAAGSKCTVSVNAEQALARVIFSSSVYLGIEYNAQVDEVITLESGTHDIVIYNAAESGPITFGISFSGAETMVATAFGAAAAAIAVLSF